MKKRMIKVFAGGLVLTIGLLGQQPAFAYEGNCEQEEKC